MRYLDVRKLLGGNSLTIPYTLTHNGLSYPIYALIDSRANGYAFIDASLLKNYIYIL